jgi:hypothetical protein
MVPVHLAANQSSGTVRRKGAGIGSHIVHVLERAALAAHFSVVVSNSVEAVVHTRRRGIETRACTISVKAEASFTDATDIGLGADIPDLIEAVGDTVGRGFAGEDPIGG